jgi:DNA-binding GntR family transcriptional regulator
VSIAARFELPATLVEVAAERLRDGILSGALEPGAKIVEEQLCADLGISRAPLREALRLLAQQGLVEHLPRRGSRVVAWSPSDVRELFGLREVLERHAVEQALPMADPDVALVPVRESLQRMVDASDELERDDAHREFHAVICGLAGNRQLTLTLEPILLKLQLPMARNLREEARLVSDREGIARHKDLLAALETNKRAAVVKALKEHGHLTFLQLGIKRRGRG